MADQRSVELLSFNSASRTFAYRRLAQGLSKALSALSSFMQEYLDTVIKADQCAQYVDDIGIAANTTEQLIKNIRVFKCIRKASLKLTIEKCLFGVTQVEFLSGTITPNGVVNGFKAINASLAEACGFELRQPVAGKQYVLMTDASFRASGYAIMIE